MKKDKKLTKEFVKKMLVEKFGEEFYHEAGLTTAENESSILRDYLNEELEAQAGDYENFDDAAFDEIIKRQFDEWSSEFLSVDEHLSNFCPACKKHWDDIVDEKGDFCEHYSEVMVKLDSLKNKEEE